MSFRRLAIVNRGDAASRCLRAVRALRAEEGWPLTAIALYTDVDRRAPFVRDADEALSLGPAYRVARGTSPGRLAYLDRARVLAALRATRADAVWAGWGFLAEDPIFVEQLEQRGIVFVGPRSVSMRTVGDKIAAKRLAERCGVAVASWSGGPVRGDELESAARALGLPLLIKAAAGGGGRGIRLVERRADLAAAFAAAAAEAAHAFGDDTLFLETIVVPARHIEVQVAADRAGRCLALGLRDCSVQRRHQKVIEEAPPPHLAAELGEGLREAAVRVMRAAGYEGVGTVEFLIGSARDADAGTPVAPGAGTRPVSAFFLEINPRLQVEHGLTEMLTGLDLVALQLRLARGDRLPERPPAEHGHAVEARICAEDPSAAFAPAPGAIVLFDPPGGPGIRTDSGTGVGLEMPAEFDQLIAKVIAHGPTRDAALARLAGALDEFRLVLAGGATNKGLLREILATSGVRRGGVDVGWLDRTLPTLPPAAGAVEALIAAAILVYQDERAAARLNFFAEAAVGPQRAIPDPTGQWVELGGAGARYRLHVLAIGGWTYRITLDGRECVARLLEQEAHAAQLVVGEARSRITVARTDGALRIEVNGRPHLLRSDRGGLVRAVAPAVVISVDVAVGDRVGAGQRLGLLETMKVEVAFHAPAAGTVTAIHVRRHERVAAGAPLMQIQPAGASESEPVESTRLALPAWQDPLLLLFDAAGKPDLAAFAGRDGGERARAFGALAGAVRRMLLGYDQRADIDAQLHAVLTAPIPAGLEPRVLAELAELRTTITVFADTEVLFSRQPDTTASPPAPSNDALTRLYLRRIGVRGAGLPARFIDLLRRALAHYELGDLLPGEALERALLRLYGARARREARYRLVGDVLRLVVRLAAAGVDLSEDRELSDTLATCIALRGNVPDAVADAALEARDAIFELPAIRRRAAQAAALLDDAVAALEQAAGQAPPIDLLSAVADGPPAVFERIVAWATDADPLRRDLALQALVLRQYAPLLPVSVRTSSVDDLAVAQIDYGGRDEAAAASAGSAPSRTRVYAAFADADSATRALTALCDRARTERDLPYLELLITGADALAASVLAEVSASIGARLPARRLCITGLAPSGLRTHFTIARDSDAAAPAAADDVAVERCNALDIHPETARRIGLQRLARFALERLPAPDGLYAFIGRNGEEDVARGPVARAERTEPVDERIFVIAEVRAALPHGQGTLHEPAFVHTFAEAVRVLRTLRSEHDHRRRLHWNRITLLVRPAFYLLPSTLDRLVAHLVPSTRHLGLEKVVVRLALRAHPGDPAHMRELAIDPDAAGGVQVAWREPHDEPLRPATAVERRLAQARRRGVVYPPEVLRLFLRDGGTFEAFDLDPGSSQPTARRTGDIEMPSNAAGVIFGVITTATAKHPEGLARVIVVSDATRDMGALGPPECDRLVAAIDLAAARGIPLEWIATSAGARIAMDSGTENLDATARVVRRIVGFTAGGGEINVIVAGVNVGAQSYFDALSTMLLHTRGILVMLAGSAMVLTGRVALEASGGVAADDEVGIGGFDRIMGPNGQAQYYAADLAAAYDILLEHYRFTYRAPGERGPRPWPTRDPAERSIADAPYPADDAEGFGTVGAIFGDAHNPGRKRPFAMRPVMRALIDRDGGSLERWAAMTGAETAIVWDAHLGGHAVCVIGIESRNLPRLGQRSGDGPEQWTAGTLFPLASKKIARGLRSASGNRPAVILATLSGFDGSPESMRTLQLEYGAEIARAVVEFEGPILFAVVSRYHGGAYVVFSRELNPRLYAVALEGSYASVIGGSAAASAVFAREVAARTDADARLRAARAAARSERNAERAAELENAAETLRQQIALEAHAAVAQEFDAVHTVERARSVGSLDRIVAVDALRRVLIERLRQE